MARRGGRTAADVLLSDCQYRKGTASGEWKVKIKHVQQNDAVFSGGHCSTAVMARAVVVSSQVPGQQRAMQGRSYTMALLVTDQAYIIIILLERTCWRQFAAL